MRVSWGEGFEQAAGVIGGGEACVEPVAQRHQFIHLCEDAALLCGVYPRLERAALDVTCKGPLTLLARRATVLWAMRRSREAFDLDRKTA